MGAGIGMELPASPSLCDVQVLHNALSHLPQPAKVPAALCNQLLQLLQCDSALASIAACCIADVLRLHAPNAPYSEHQLQSLFNGLFPLLRSGLSSNRSPIYARCRYLLDSLAAVKSAILICDLSDAPSRVPNFFRLLFDIAACNTHVHAAAADILLQLINETTVTPALVRAILAQFVKPTPALPVARLVCARASDRLQTPLCRYFTDIFAPDTDDDDDQLRSAHSIIARLGSAAPALLDTLLPFLESHLHAQNPVLRCLAIDSLAQLIASSSAALVAAYPQSCAAWIARHKDKSAQVRSSWLLAAKDIFKAKSIAPADFGPPLTLLLQDPDSKVRASACSLLGSLDSDTLSSFPLTLLEHRPKDKSPAVRQSAMIAIAHIWLRVDWARGAQLHIASLPSAIFDAVYVNDSQVNDCIEETLHSTLFPAHLDETATVERILLLLKHLSPKSAKAFFAVLRKQIQWSAPVLKLLDLCEKFSAGIDSSYTYPVQQIASSLAGFTSDPQKTEKNIFKFAKLHDKRCYNLLRKIMNPQTDYLSVRKAQNEALKRISQASPSIAETWAPIINRTALSLYNKSFIPILVAFSRDPQSALDHPAHLFLKEIAEAQPLIYKQSITDITTLLCVEANSCPQTETIKSLACFAKTSKDLPHDQSLLDALCIFAQSGSPPQAKHAVTILANLDTAAITGLLSTIMANFAFESTNFVSQMSVIRQLVLCMPHVLQDHVDRITEYVIKEILLQNKTKKTSDDPDWMDDQEKETLAKVLSIQFLVNRLRASCEDSSQLAPPVFKLLGSVIANDGEITKDKDTRLYTQSRQRLVAGQCLLKLAGIKVYEKMISPQDFNKIAYLIQDSCFYVRQGIVSKLIKALALDRIPPKYFALLFLIAHEPQQELFDEVKLSLKSKSAQLRSRKLHHLELALPRVLHLLAHHPDFSSTPQDLLDFSKYLLFFLETIANANNISLLFHLAQRTKQIRDAIDPDHSQNLYAMSDLAQVLIKTRADKMGWVMQTYPQKVKLDNDIFKSLPDSATAADIARTSFLPSQVLSSLQTCESNPNKKVSPSTFNKTYSQRKVAEEAVSPAKKPRPTPRKVKTPRKDVTPSERRRSARVSATVSYCQDNTDSGESLSSGTE